MRTGTSRRSTGCAARRSTAAGPLDVLVGGVGPAASAASAAFALAADRYDLVISAGIGGGFAPVAPVGSLAVSSRIGAADLGADTPAGFVPVTELGFGRTWHLPPRSLVRAAAGATGAATGDILTVSTVTGTAERTAALLTAHPHAVAEAMEGFGVAEAADLAERTGPGDQGRVEHRRPARPRRLAHRRRADRADRGVREAHTRTGRLDPP